jgi:hypothetical protein
VAVAPASGGGGGLLNAMIAAAGRPTLLQPLRMASAEMEGDTLLLCVPPDFLAFAEMNADEYRQLATKIAGKATKISIRAGSSPAPLEAPVTPAETKKQDLMTQAAQEPVVKEALDLFGARLVDVREAQKEGS